MHFILAIIHRIDFEHSADKIDKIMIINGVTLILGLHLISLTWDLTEAKSNEHSPWDSLNLPLEHVPYYFKSHPGLKKICSKDLSCPYKSLIETKKCWGYENGCTEDKRWNPFCPTFAPGWAKTTADQISKFWTAADFGYVKERLDELNVFCKPENEHDSYLACAKYTRYCRAKNIYLDFTTAKLMEGANRYREDVFKSGQIGGHCKMDQNKFKQEGNHKSPLQSWFAELEQFTELDFQPIADGKCDIVLDKPTIFMKLDAGVNMYHHFCDYVNLYAAQHINGSFDQDIYIVMWDTSPMTYGDFFSDTWKAFTHHPIIHLNTYDGKKVCVADAVFPLLPRMQYGLYYNMPLIPGCHSSSLFRAFSQHVLHRLNITQEGPLETKVRVTLLSRGTKYRKILNEEELVSAMKSVGSLDVQVVDYNHRYPFLKQLQVTHNSDVFIGMHGAGLTHMLFQPDWGVLFELYNCDDEHCYKDLARLRGLRYMTWENIDKLTQEDEGHHPQLGAHKKFTNYAFNVKEFMRLVMSAVDYVQSHPRFLEERNNKYGRSIRSEEL